MAMGIMNWNIQQGGDDDNGGGFLQGGAQTDYTLQDAAQLTVTDGATSGVGVTTLTSTTGGFTSAMVGNIVHLYDGTNLTDGWYEIQGHTDTNTVTLDRAPDDGVGGVSAADCKVGGALATTGGLGAVLASDVAVRIEGSRGWLKYDATTYKMTSGTANVAGGQFEVLTGWNYPFALIGYETTMGTTAANRPQIDSNGQTVTRMLYHQEASGTNTGLFANIIVAKTGGGSVTAGIQGNTGAVAYNCKSTGAMTYNFQYMFSVNCVADGGAYGFNHAGGNNAYKCVALNCTTAGFSNGSMFECLGYDCAKGFRGPGIGVRCVAVDNTDDGFDNRGAFCLNCVSTDNTGYGFGHPWVKTDYGCHIECYTHNNSGGSYESGTLPNYFSGPLATTYDITNLSASPWVDQSTDKYWLNNNNPGGAELRAAGLTLPLSGVVDEPDIAATQHADPAGGGGLLIHPGTSGGMRG